MTAAATEINQHTAERRRMVPEPYFVNILLPTLRKWIRREDVEVGHYLNVADGLNNEITVIDENGVKLYDVPPLFVDTPTRVARFDDNNRIANVHKLVQIQGMKADNGEMRDFMNIEDDLVDMLTPRAEDAAKTEALVKLVYIYDRYDLPLEELVGDIAPVIRKALQDGKKTGPSGHKVESRSDAREEDDFIID
jgi:hypothetical protein